MEIEKKIKRYFCILCFIAITTCASCCYATTYYVNESAINNAGDGLSPETAKHNIVAALVRCNKTGGDTVIIMDGIYDEERDRISQDALSKHSVAYTTIKAQNRWKVEIRQPLDCNRDQSGRNYIHLDGLRFTALAQHSFNGSNWKITNSAFYGSLVMGNSFQERHGVHSKNILIEDCHVWGPGGVNAYRYKVTCQSCSNVIWRRVVARHDGGYISRGYLNPSAVFTVYSSEHVRLQNCIAIDSPGQPNEHWSAAFFTADHQSNAELYFQDVRWEGCIAMNIKNCKGFDIDNDHGFKGYETIYDNCAILGESTYGFYSYCRTKSNDKIIYNQCTVINCQNEGFKGADHKEYDKAVQYSLMLNLKGAAIGRGINNTLYNNAYGCRNNNPGKRGSRINPRQNGLLYPVRIETGSKLANMANGARIGADITRAWGEKGTMWGESGFDSLTSISLWPFPNEEQIKKDFATIVAGNNSDTRRGFCADGITLTKYIWEYLGSPIPPEIYGDKSLE